MQKTKFPSHKQFFRASFPQKCKKNSCRPKNTAFFPIFFFCIFFFVETNDNNPNVTTATNLFSSVYVVGMTCFDECFLLYVITERPYFLKSFSLLGGFFQPLLRPLEEVFRKRSAFYVISTITVQCFKNKVCTCKNR